MTPPTKKIVCRVRVDEAAKSVEFTWSEGSAAFKRYALENEQVTDFRDNIQTARKNLLGLVTCHEVPLDRRDSEGYRRACLELAQAGHSLYNQVFDRFARDGEHVSAIKCWLRDLTASGQVESVEVVCEGQPWFAPWNLIYDEEPEESAFDGGMSGFAPFWGMRYNLCGGQPVDPLRRMPLPSKPEVMVVIDPKVLADLRDYPGGDGATQCDQLTSFLAGKGLVPVDSQAALARALKQRRPHVIYWLGHADPNALHLGPERIDQVVLRNLLRNMDEGSGQAGGLVFLNACRTAESGDLGSFLATFHKVGFSGLIATEEQTLDSFANPFGLGVLERFFTPGTLIGGLLRDLRRSHGPLGLLYGAYCPPDLHVRQEGVPDGRGDGGRVEDPTAAGGRTLGASRAAVLAEPVSRDLPLPEVPYIPLGSYGPECRALFAGRDDDVTRFALILDRPETRVMVLHGESGVGKTSFLRAGLIPFLEEDCIGYRFLRDRAEDDRDGSDSPVLFVRATNDPTGQIARALVDFGSRALTYPTPTGETIEADLPAVFAATLGMDDLPTAAALSERLLNDPSLLGRVLGGLSRALPVTLVLIIDQAEEMFTLARSPEEEFGRDRVLEMLRQIGDRRGDFKLIVSLRTEYYGRLVSALRRGLAEADGVREYLLTDLDVPAMVDVIRRPTLRGHLRHAAEIPSERYGGFDYADGVPEAIARQVARHGRTDGVTLLLQVICAQLFERAMGRGDRRVTEDDLREIGGFEGALGRHAERQIRGLFRDLPEDAAHAARGGFGRAVDFVVRGLSPAARGDRERFQVLLTRLTLSQGDGTLTTALLREDDLRRQWDGREPFDAMLPRAYDLRLLRTTTRRLDDGGEDRLVSLGHDALAKVAQPWKQELERRAERRKWLKLSTAGAAALLAFVLLSLSLFRVNRRVAEANKDLAETNVNLHAARQDADEKRRWAELRRYDFNMMRCQTAWNLDDCRPVEETLGDRDLWGIPGEDFRGFEWYYWETLLRVRSKAIAGHDGAVLGVAFSGDGRRIASASDDRTIRIWDAGSGHQLTLMEGHTGPVTSVAFCGDDRRIGSASRDGTVRIWDVDSGRQMMRMNGHTGPVSALAFRGDGRRVASASDDTTVRIWDVDSGRPLTTMSGHTGPVYGVAFSRDGRRIASASGDMTVRVWDADSGGQLMQMNGHSKAVRGVAFIGDVNRVLSVSDDKTGRIWDVASGQTVGSQGLPAEVRGLAFSRDGTRMALGTRDVHVWDTANNQFLVLLRGHTGPIRGLSFADDGRRIASASEDRTVRMWDAEIGQEPAALQGHTGPVRCVAFSGDGRRIASASDDRTVQVWDAGTRRRTLVLKEHDDGITAVAFGGDGRRIASASRDGTVVVCDADSGRRMLALRGQDDWITGLAYSRDGRQIATSTYGSKVRLWDADTGQLVLELKGIPDSPVRRLAFSADDRRLASASEDGVVRIWDAASGDLQNELIGHTQPVTGIAFARDGRRLVSCSTDQTLRLWDVEINKPIAVISGHAARIDDVAFSGDGRRIASASEDGTVRVWNADTGQQVLTLGWQGGSPCGLAFSGDGRRIALATLYANRVGVWDTMAGREEPSTSTGGPGDPGSDEAKLLPALDVGDFAPEFVARELGTGRLKLADRRGKLIVLHFWSTWSAPSLAEMPAMKALHESFGSDPRFELIGISGDGDIEMPRRYARENGLDWTQGFATSMGDYLVRAIPALFLIGPDGRILAKNLKGRALEEAVRVALNDDRLFAGAKSATRPPRFPVARFEDRGDADSTTGAPAAVVLDDCDEDFQEARPHHDGLRFLTESGEERRHLKQFNTSETIGSNHCVALDAARGRIYVAESNAERVTAFNLRGRRLWQASRINVSAFGVDPGSGHLWCCLGNGGETVVLDGDGTQVDSHPFGGFDISYDSHTDGFWLVGNEITKLNRAGDVSYQKPHEGWMRVSVACDPRDGSAWIAERAHVNIPGSVNRLWHLDANGGVIGSQALENKVPFAVACDPRTGTAWLVSYELLRFARDGRELTPLPIAATAVAISPTTGHVWVTTQTEVLRLDASGAILGRTPFGAFSGQSRVVAF